MIGLLTDANATCLNCREELDAFNPGRLENQYPLIFILPIRGDIDLLDSHFAQLKAIARHQNCLGRTLIFVLHGDRHVWDEMKDTLPIYAKLKAMFFYSGALFICPEKLDLDSAKIVAQYVIDAIFTERCEQEWKIAAIACLLNKRSHWHPHKKHLGLYDESTGQSQLASVSFKKADAVLNIIQEIELNSLELNHAALVPAQLAGKEFSAKRIDFIGNQLDLAGALASPKIEWINLAANGLTSVDISLCPPTLQHLYLHKNSIQTMIFPIGLACKLSSLSVYRNCLTSLDLPRDQTGLIRLNVGANPIIELPEELQNARDLEFLGIARTHLCKLPGWLFEMPNLKEVDLSYMQHLIPARQIQTLISRGVKIILEPGKQHHEFRI